MSEDEKTSLMATDNLFVAYCHKMRDAIDAALMGAFAIPIEQDLKSLLYRPLEDFIASGGKRTRPVLVCLSAQACGANPHDALQVAASLEYFQAAALIHDDIADNSQTRRGLPCLYKNEGTGPALNQGDLALIESYACIIEDDAIDANLARNLLKEIATMQRHTAEGQALDLGWVREKKWDITPEDYLRMATLKTAWYSVATPLVLGALFAGAPQETIEALRHFGLDLGVVFQITDDILNLKGSKEAQGKDFRSDITEGKRTLLSTYALQNLSDQKKQELRAILSRKTTDENQHEKAASLMKEAGAFEYAQNISHDLFERAMSYLEDTHLGLNAAASEDADARKEKVQSGLDREKSQRSGEDCKREKSRQPQPNHDTEEARMALQSLAEFVEKRTY